MRWASVGWPASAGAVSARRNTPAPGLLPHRGGFRHGVVIAAGGRLSTKYKHHGAAAPRLAHEKPCPHRPKRRLSELPKTPTQKVQKHLLRSEGVTPETFDRVRAGMVLRRQRI